MTIDSPGVVYGPVFASHPGDTTSIAYGYDSNTDLAILLVDGGLVKLSPPPFRAGLQGGVDPTNPIRFDVASAIDGGPAAMFECQVADPAVACEPPCTLLNGFDNFRFAPSGDLWIVNYPGGFTLANLPTTGACHLYHVTAAAQLFAGRFSTTPACPEVSLDWSERPEGFDQIGVSDSGVYLSYPPHPQRRVAVATAISASATFAAAPGPPSLARTSL